MAIVYLDGFDHYSNSTGSGDRLYELVPSLWSTYDPDDEQDSSHGDTDTMPELGSRGLRLYYNTGSGGIGNSRNTNVLMNSPETWSDGSTFGVGFHHYIEALPTLSFTGGIIGFGGPSSLNRSLRIDTSGEAVFWSGDTQDGSEIEGTGWFPSSGTLYHIELKMFIDGSVGTLELRVDGTTVYSGTNLNTLGDGSFSRVWFAPASATTDGTGDDETHVWYDNLFFWNTSGSINNDFLGERNIYTLFPDGDTATEEWALSSGSDSFDLVNNVPPDPLVDYLEAQNNGDETIMTVEDLPSTEISVTAVQITSLTYKTGTTDTRLDAGIIINSNEDAGTFSLAQDNPQYKYHISEISPDTSASYTPTEINGMEIIIRRNDA